MADIDLALEWDDGAWVVIETIGWFLDKCRVAGLTEWAQIEALLREKPNCTDRIVENIRVAWEMHL